MISPSAVKRKAFKTGVNDPARVPNSDPSGSITLAITEWICVRGYRSQWYRGHYMGPLMQLTDGGTSKDTTVADFHCDIHVEHGFSKPAFLSQPVANAKLISIHLKGAHNYFGLAIER